MKKSGLILFLVSGYWFLVTSAYAQETIEILTYYPAPYGVYQTLRVSYSLSRLNSTCYGEGIVVNRTYKYKDTHINLGWASVTGTSGQNYWHCTVGGGYQNTASAQYTTVGGGQENSAGGLLKYYATVGGGWQNTASGSMAYIGGGGKNTASGSYATVGGGIYNTADQSTATVGGGNYNTAGGYNATVGGGVYNTASGYTATVGGGGKNTASGYYSTVGGGDQNKASGTNTTVGGGYYNSASNNYATVGGGWGNTASGQVSTVCGGGLNTASGYCSTVGGGYWNSAANFYSFAAGYRAKAVHQGCFVWADSTNEDYPSTDINQFRVRASGGAYLGGGAAKVWSDVSEYMDVLKSDGAENGDLVSLKEYDRLGKSSNPYDSNLIGAISSERTFTLHLGDEKPSYDDTERFPITLVGRVFVKVNNENGSIKIGDLITSSSTPGVGMKAVKAGKIIGYAMEEFNDKEGEILVFVNLSYYIPPEEYFKMQDRLKDLEESVSSLKKGKS